MIKKLLPNVLLIATLLLYSCKKENKSPVNPYTALAAYHLNMPDSADNNPYTTATLNVNEATTGPVIPTDFLGFSFEKQSVTDLNYFNASNSAFINMFRNLDNGLIRIGGATVDQTYFSGNQRTSLRIDSVYADDIDRYKAFAQAVGWKTIWGLNLGRGTPENDAEEAQYVSKSIGSQVASFAIGNEPAYYASDYVRPASYTEFQYLNEFNNFSSTIRNKLPGAVFSGPDNPISLWGLDFMQSVDARINLLTAHYYRMGPAGNQFVTMDALLTFDQKLQGLVVQAGPSAQKQHLPYRVTECNSVYGGGEPGMSDAYAASLWGSEFLFYLAQQGAAGINFHTGGTAEYVYSPISTVNSKSVAKPLYYAMLVFHQANIRQFTSNTLTNSSNLNIDTYSFITKDNKNGILVINKDLQTDLSIKISTNELHQTATVYELNGPSLSSLTGTNINGAMVNDDGTFSVSGVNFNLAKQYAAVLAKVKPTSAMLIILD
jgi:hypothetical protein